MTVHYKKEFVNWLEDNLDVRRKNTIQEHFNHCSACKNYFEKMKKSMANPPASYFRVLEPQPYEKTKIMALVESQQKKTSFQIKRLFKTVPVLYPLLLVLAIIIGIWIGENLVSTEQESELYTFALEEQDYLHISESGFDKVWRDLNGETQNED